MLPRALVIPGVESSALIMSMTPLRGLSVLSSVVHSHRVDINWCRLSGGAERVHLIAEIATDTRFPFALEQHDPILVKPDVPSLHGMTNANFVFLEARLPFESGVLAGPTDVILEAFRQNLTQPFTLSISRRPYVLDTSGYYLRVQMLGDRPTVDEMVGGLENYWRLNGFHPRLLQWHIEQDSEAL